ncbi:MAG: hypothetical protein ACKPKO_36840, partial [Candidatus Fonsibacter sp.]
MGLIVLAIMYYPLCIATIPGSVMEPAIGLPCLLRHNILLGTWLWSVTNNDSGMLQNYGFA